MLEIVEGKLQFPKYKVKYKQRGENLETYTNDTDWWIEFAEKWNHTKILKFEDAEFTEAQHARLKEVEDLPEAYAHFAEMYVIDGIFPDELPDDERVENHPLQVLQLKNNEKILGQMIADLELQLLTK